MYRWAIPVILLAATTAKAQPEFRKRLQTQLILAEDGDTIRIPEGTHVIDATLSMEGKHRVVITGAGMDRTILSFKGQQTGAEGIRVSNGSGITIRDLTVRDAKGDAVKTMNLTDVRFIRVRTDWSGRPSPGNGAYGLYPVSCQGVTIDSCEARGASDAGIYVGQSRDIVVSHCRAFENVAGIEIENSVNAEVHHNDAYRNTGGILVFDLPDLPVKKGGHCRVYQNRIHDNNLANFAPKGNIVGTVPQGTGILLLAANHVEVFQNEIRDNRTLGTCIASYHITEKRIRDSAYHPFPTAISIHDNTFSRKRVRATLRGRMGKLFRLKLRFGRDVPDILFDGILDPALAGANGSYPPAHRICIRNNANARFAALDAANGFRNISTDTSGYDCDITVNPDRKTGGRP
jgi:parallel beta-helix repeat protein